MSQPQGQTLHCGANQGHALHPAVYPVLLRQPSPCGRSLVLAQGRLKIPGVSVPRGGHGNSLQYSCLENPMDEGAQRTTVHGVLKSQCVCGLL